MNHSASNHIIASIGTIVIMALVALLLYLLSIPTPQVQEEEGIELAFEPMGEGGPHTEAAPVSSPLTPQPASLPAPAVQSRPSNNDLMVQDDASLRLAQQREEDARRKAQEKALAERRAREQQAIERANQMGSLFGNTSSSEPAAAATQTQANPASGKGNPVYKGYGGPQGGPTWTLKGRDCVHLARPASDFKQPGKVLVNIEVDTEGRVTKASVGDGTTISDAYTQQLAIDAAKKTTFTKGQMAQRGQILYKFKFN